MKRCQTCKGCSKRFKYELLYSIRCLLAISIVFGSLLAIACIIY
ncbi:hypothetical protein [Clostridium sp. UBA3061]